MTRLTFFCWIMMLLALLFISCKKEYADTAIVIRNAVTDYDGHKYDAVKIGDQIWMASNLRVKHFADGEKIPFSSEFECDYTNPIRYSNGKHQDGNLITNQEKRCGFLYNWYAVMRNADHSDAAGHIQGICPNGWHVPTEEEWRTLRNTVASSETYMKKSGSVSKALADQEMWLEPLAILGSNHIPGYNSSKNNSTGFSALPAGAKGSWMAEQEGYDAYFWSCTVEDQNNANYVNIDYLEPGLLFRSTDKIAGMSVRCVKD